MINAFFLIFEFLCIKNARIKELLKLLVGVVYKELDDGTLLNLNSGELYKRIADGTIIKLDTSIAVPIKIK